MSAPEHPQNGSSSDVKEHSGLPAISPDVVEQEQGDEFDDIVPSKAYDMLPVVGLGGSAGSIQALRQFFEVMPEESGMAFVVVLHLAPENASIMDDILGRTTQMPVVQAVDGQKLEANHVYVIPPGKLLSAQNGSLCLTPIEAERGKRTAVDLFFRTLADTHGPNASAIILSGADGDGALGIKRIKERGGLTVAQDPEEAEHPSMPRSAIDTGMVDWVLPVEQMPERLLQYRQNGKRLQLPPEEGPQPAREPLDVPDADEAALREVLIHLRSRTGRDFSYYKRATVVRRLARRMQVNSVGHDAGVSALCADASRRGGRAPGGSADLGDELLPRPRVLRGAGVTHPAALQRQEIVGRDPRLDGWVRHRGGGVQHRDAAAGASGAHG
jgi:two-component system CheB/CheR fusion protein